MQYAGLLLPQLFSIKQDPLQDKVLKMHLNLSLHLPSDLCNVSHLSRSSSIRAIFLHIFKNHFALVISAHPPPAASSGLMLLPGQPAQPTSLQTPPPYLNPASSLLTSISPLIALNVPRCLPKCLPFPLSQCFATPLPSHCSPKVSPRGRGCHRNFHVSRWQAQSSPLLSSL